VDKNYAGISSLLKDGGVEMVGKLTAVWHKCKTKQLAAIFESYMESIGIRKYDERRKDNTNTYMVDGKSTGWNRVQCYYNKDSTRYCTEDLLLVLRKEAGNYFIIQRKGDRAFEVDYSGVRHHDEALLAEIMKDHKPLFDTLLEQFA
jgi:hypothetical protein